MDRDDRCPLSVRQHHIAELARRRAVQIVPALTEPDHHALIVIEVSDHHLNVIEAQPIARLRPSRFLRDPYVPMRPIIRDIRFVRLKRRHATHATASPGLQHALLDETTPATVRCRARLGE